MKIKEIEFFNLAGESLDVLVTLEDKYCDGNFSYFVEVVTLNSLINDMKKAGSEFVPPGYPCIIVSKLTRDIIQAAIQEFIDVKEDSYWLKLYHVSGTLKINDINEILSRKKLEMLELEAKIDKEIEEESN